MDTTITLRQRLGLAEEDPVLESRLALPDTDEVEGRGVLSRASLVSVVLLQGSLADTRPLHLPAVEAAGQAIGFSEGTGFLHLRESSGAQLRVLAVTGDAMVEAGVGDLVVRFDRAGELAVATRRGGVLVLSVREAQLEAQLFGESATEVTPPWAEAVRAWGEAVAQEWLHSEIMRRLDSGGPWNALAAAGLVARHGMSPVLPREREPDLAPSASRAFPAWAEWARSLPSGDLLALGAKQRSRVGTLGRELQQLRESFDPLDAAWTVRFREACVLREEIEGVAVIARAAGAAEAHALPALVALDQSAVALGALLQVHFDEEPLLSQVAHVDPLAWWGA